MRRHLGYGTGLRRRWCGAALLAGGLLLALGPTSMSAALAEPALEPTACWSARSSEANARCFYLTVPESRERPNGRSIRIAVTILMPDGAMPDTLPAPLVYLNGGPGMATGLSGEDLDRWVDWHRGWPGGSDRALILVDQRGTGHSQPRLYCDREVYAEAMRAYFGTRVPRDPLGNAEWLRGYVLDCRAPFEAAGIDVNAYNSAENAADFVALREALGLGQWDVWGASYGAELALELLRIDEAGIRSLILDSVSLYNHPGIVPGNSAAAFDRALTQIYRDCLLDQVCSATFPGLSTRLGSGLAWLKLKPETLTLSSGYDWDGMEFVLDHRSAVELLLFALYRPEFVPGAPATITAFALRDLRAAENLANYRLSMLTLLPMAEVIQVSTMCRAAPRGEALAELRDQEHRYPNYAALWWADYLETVCAGWGAAPARPAEMLPVHSDVPALILAGRYDPVTPPDWGQIVAGWLPNSRLIEFPHLSHGSVSLDPCADTIAAAFLDDPEDDPLRGCFDALSKPSFAVN